MKVVRLLLVLFLAATLADAAYAARGVACDEIAAGILKVGCPNHASCDGRCNSFVQANGIDNPCLDTAQAELVEAICAGLTAECFYFGEKIDFVTAEFALKCDMNLADQIKKMLYEYGLKCSVDIEGLEFMKATFDAAYKECMVSPICKELEKLFAEVILKAPESCADAKGILGKMAENKCDFTAEKAVYDKACPVLCSKENIETLQKQIAVAEISALKVQEPLAMTAYTVEKAALVVDGSEEQAKLAFEAKATADRLAINTAIEVKPLVEPVEKLIAAAPECLAYAAYKDVRIDESLNKAAATMELSAEKIALWKESEVKAIAFDAVDLTKQAITDVKIDFVEIDKCAADEQACKECGRVWTCDAMEKMITCYCK